MGVGGVFLIKKCYHLEVDRECDLDLVTMILILIFGKVRRGDSRKN